MEVLSRLGIKKKKKNKEIEITQAKALNLGIRILEALWAQFLTRMHYLQIDLGRIRQYDQIP